MTTTAAFDAKTAIATARLLIRTAGERDNPFSLDADMVACAVQLIGDGRISPDLPDLLGENGPEFDAAGRAEVERLTATIRSSAPGARHPLDIPGAYPAQTGNNLAMVGLALSRAWEIERERAGDAGVRRAELEAFLDGYLERTVHDAAAAVFGLPRSRRDRGEAA